MCDTEIVSGPAGKYFTASRASNYAISLADLERSARVPLEEQVEEQLAHHPGTYVEPEDFERRRLLAIAGAPVTG